MRDKPSFLLVSFLLSFSVLYSQETPPPKERDSIETIPENIKIKDTVPSGDVEVTAPVTIDPLRPSKAAFYSAILPGLGQAYNRRYWKIPIVYAAIGTGLYFYIDNNSEYNRYRDAYKRRLAGFDDDEFNGENGPFLSDAALIDAQETFQRNRDLALVITIGLYILNIVDANVDAHLMQYNVNENLSIRPHYQQNEVNSKNQFGLTLDVRF